MKEAARSFRWGGSEEAENQMGYPYSRAAEPTDSPGPYTRHLPWGTLHTDNMTGEMTALWDFYLFFFQHAGDDRLQKLIAEGSLMIVFDNPIGCEAARGAWTSTHEPTVAHWLRVGWAFMKNMGVVQDLWWQKSHVIDAGEITKLNDLPWVIAGNTEVDQLVHLMRLQGHGWAGWGRATNVEKPSHQRPPLPNFGQEILEDDDFRPRPQAGPEAEESPTTADEEERCVALSSTCQRRPPVYWERKVANRYRCVQCSRNPPSLLIGVHFSPCYHRLRFPHPGGIHPDPVRDYPARQQLPLFGV